MSGKIMLIDGNSIVNRAFYGVPLLSNSKGQYTNAIYGFFNILFKMTDDEKPEYIGVAFDLKAPTFRHKKFEDYKGTRKAMPEELASQMPVLKELLKLLNIKQYSLEGYEADDILGTLSKQAEEKGYETVVVSGDRDLLQLASESLKIKIPKTIKGKTEVEDYYAKDVVEKYGVTPTEFIEVKALMGDSSDNIPGVPSIGEKTAVKIIQQFKTVDEAIKNADSVKPAKASNNLKEYEEQARLSRFLVEIDRNAPVELDLNHMPILGGKISGEAYEYIKNLDFKSLLNRFTTEESTVEKITEESNSEYFYIDNAEDCEKFVYESFSKKSAYVIIEEDNKIEGISIFADGKGCFIESNENFTSEEIVKVLEKYFGDESIEKIGHNIKNDMKLLRPVELKGASFDTQIAAYILNSTEDTYNFDDIARDYLSLTIKSEEEVLGKGKKRVSIRTLDKNKRIDYAVKQAEVMFNAKDIMLEKIKENNQEKLFVALGWKHDDRPEVGELPDPDLNRIASMNPAVDKEQAVENSYTMKVNKRKLENAKSSDTKETLEKTIREDTQSIGASVTSSYQNVLAAKASMELKQAQAQLQEKSMQTTERQYHLGMIGRLDYLNRKYAYDSAVIQTQIAKYNLLQAIQSYEWVLDGLANAS